MLANNIRLCQSAGNGTESALFFLPDDAFSATANQSDGDHGETFPCAGVIRPLEPVASILEQGEEPEMVAPLPAAVSVYP
jgi:hypothetical protein